MLDRFLKRDVDEDFASLSTRDIEELIARDPEVAALVQNIGENFVKRDGTEITTRDLQLVTRDSGSAGLGQGLWSSVKSLFGRDLEADALVARDLDTLRDHFVRRDGGEITGDDLGLFVREAPKSGPGASSNPLGELNKKLKSEEKKLDGAGKKFEKDMKAFGEKMEGGEHKKHKDGESKKGHGDHDSEHKHGKSEKSSLSEKHGKHGKEGSKLSTHHGDKEHKHGHSDKHGSHHKSKKTKSKAKKKAKKAKAKAKAKKLKAKHKKLQQQKKKAKAKIEKKKEKAEKMQKEVETAEKKLEKLNDRLEKLEKKEDTFEKKHSHDSEKKKSSSKKDKRDELWAREAEAEAYADPDAWAEAEAFFDEDDLELIARELVDLERREPGLIGSVVKGGEKLLGKAGGSAAKAGAKDVPKAIPHTPAPGAAMGGASKTQKAADFMNAGSNVAMTGMMAQGMYGQPQQKRDLGSLFDDGEFDLFARDASYGDMDDEFDLFAREAEPDFGFEEELWAREASPEAEPEAEAYAGFAGWDMDGLEELYE